MLLGPVQRQIKFAQTRRAELDRLPAVVEEVRFATDSPLEGARFEPSVPRKRDPFKFAQKMQPVRRTHNEAL